MFYILEQIDFISYDTVTEYKEIARQWNSADPEEFLDSGTTCEAEKVERRTINRLQVLGNESPW